MKKVILMSLACCMAAMAQAKILRVSNVTGSTAPYTTYADAELAAEEGDTIVLESSETAYQVDTIAKRIVLMGHGYWKVENGIVSEGCQSAKIVSPTVNYRQYPICVAVEGTVIQGLEIGSWINLIAPKCVLERNLIQSDVAIDKIAVGAVIHSNYLNGVVGVYGCNRISYDVGHSMWDLGEGPAVNVAIINNVISPKGHYGYLFKYLDNSYIAYNTYWVTSEYDVTHATSIIEIKNSTFEYNIIPTCDGRPSIYDDLDGSNKIGDEQLYEVDDNLAQESQAFPSNGEYKSDLNIKNYEMKFTDGKHGAFAGTDPYVISGVPAGPVIEDIEMPVSVEKGKKLEVTVKVKIQK
jgi:hypothetical protein